MIDLTPLKEGAPQYLWVLDRNTERWLVSDWQGNEAWLVADAVEAKPDLQRVEGERRMPVVCRIGSGQPAQYFRFERRRAP